MTFYTLLRPIKKNLLKLTKLKSVGMKKKSENIKPYEHFMILIDHVEYFNKNEFSNNNLLAFSMKGLLTDTDHHQSTFTQNEKNMQHKVFSIVTAEFDNCEDAIEAIGLLMDNGLEEKNISVIGKYELLQELIDEEYALDEMAEKSDSILAALDNFGTLKLPTTQTVFVAGALVGKHKINGTIVSLNSNNILSILKSWGLSNPLINRYLDHIAQNKTLVLAIGQPTEINRATSTLKYDTLAKAVDAFTQKQQIEIEHIHIDPFEDLETEEMF